MVYISGSVNNPPIWEAPHNGLIRPTGTADVPGTNKSDHINQFLGAHSYFNCYTGDPINPSNPVSGGTDFTWVTNKATRDYSQPFTTPASFTGPISRVTIPLLAINSGAPVRVSLCPDSGGGSSPNVKSPIAQTVIPATWLTTLGAQYGITQGGPMAHPMFNTMYMSGGTTASTWVGPGSVFGGGTAGFSASDYDGNFFIMAGGRDNSGNAIPLIATSQYLGGATMGASMAGPSLPASSYNGVVTATGNTLIYAGGQSNASTTLSTVYTASWNSLTGAIGSWSAQASLPSVMASSSATSYDTTNTFYIVGGVDAAGNINSNVYYATPSNGQISSWNVGPTLPVPTWGGALNVLGNFLIYAGGSTTWTNTGGGGTGVQTVWYCNIDPATGNIIGTWQKGPALPVGVYNTWGGTGSNILTDTAIIMTGGGTTTGSHTNLCQVLTAGNGDLAPQWEVFRWIEANSQPWAAFPTGNNGQWEAFRMRSNSGTIYGVTLTPVPRISVPLPDMSNSMTGNTTYHVVVQVGPGVDSNSYVQIGFSNGTQNLPNAIQRTRHFNNNDTQGTWSNVSVTDPNGNVLNTPVSIPIGVFNQGAQTYTAVSGAVSKLVHTWEDPALSPGSGVNRYSNLQNLAAKVTTFTKNYKHLVTGIAEGYLSNLTPINRDPLFLAGTTYYTPIGGATFTVGASPSPVSGVSSTSGIITSTGTTTSKVQSEYLPVISNWASLTGDANSAYNSFFYMVAVKMYCTAANQALDISVDWYDSGVNYITTSNYTVSNIAANTWADLVAFYNPPSGAKFARIVPLGSNLANGVQLYINSLMMLYSPECVPVLGPVTQMTYTTAQGGSYPANLVQLA